MTTAFKDEFIDRIKAEGRAEGEAAGRAEGEVKGRAEMLLRILAARGLEVPDRVRERVLTCTDLSQLDAWGDSAVTATTPDEVFPG
jgi:predicted transposase YdaD